jgi:hypothetical protein
MQTWGRGHGDDSQGQNSQGENHRREGGHFNLTVGTTFTLANLTGHWVAFSNGGNRGEGDEINFFNRIGSSNGTFTFKVTSATEEGFNLTITSGKFFVNGTTYTVSSGRLTLNDGGESGFGNGTASKGATFEIHVAGLHGNLTSSALVGAVRLDLKAGTSDYLVILGSHQGVRGHFDVD